MELPTAQTLLLCLYIFCSRILDVSFGTIRTVAVVKEKRLLAAMVGFCEVMIWFVVARAALNNADSSMFVAIAYSGGFATGTYVGTYLSKMFVKTKVQVQVVTSGRDKEMIHNIRAKGFAVSVVDVNSSEFGNEKYMLFIEVDNKRMTEVKKLVSDMDPGAFIVTNESKMVMNGFFKNK